MEGILSGNRARVTVGRYESTNSERIGNSTLDPTGENAVVVRMAKQRGRMTRKLPSWSQQIKAFCRSAGLSQTGCVFGLGPLWPATLPSFYSAV